MTRYLKRFSGRCFRLVLISFLLFTMLLFQVHPLRVGATPTGPEVQYGDVGVEYDQNHTIVDITSNEAIINWASLDTVSGEVLEFIQQSSSSAVLNRVISGSPTQFDGSLLANGRVFVVNPAGVIFGAGSTINVAELVASSLNINNDDFINGRYDFAEGNGVVINEGHITAENVALIGKKVFNTGVISSPEGYVVMLAGDRVLLGQEGSNVVIEVAGVTLPEGAEVQSGDIGNVVNEGTIEAPGGNVILAAGDIFSRAITGVESLAVKVDGGNGRVEQLGTINVDGASGDGGSISLTAGNEVILGSESITTANGTASGDGGEVIVYSPELAVFSEDAIIEAKGGSESGDGGFVEISADEFIFAGDVDTSAMNGDYGTLLLDPDNITIKDGDGTNTANIVYEEQLETMSTNIELEATDYILMEDLHGDGDNELDVGERDVILKTTGEDSWIAFEDKDDSIVTSTGDIIMHAGGGGIDIGNLLVGERILRTDSVGLIELKTDNGGDISTGYLNVLGGSEVEILVRADGNLDINGSSSTGAVRAWTNVIPMANEATAEICLQAEGNINVDYGIEAEAHGKVETTANIHIHAGGDINVDAHNGWVQAKALTSENTSMIDKAEAIIEIHSEDGTITIDRNGDESHYSVWAIANSGNGSGAVVKTSDDEGIWEDTFGDDYARIEIDESFQGTCPDCIPDDDDEDDDDEDDEEPAHLVQPGPEEYENACELEKAAMAAQLGMTVKQLEDSFADILLQSPDAKRELCETCARFISSAKTMVDASDTGVAALGKVISQFVRPDVPITEENMASVNQVLALHAEDDTYYAAAGEWLDALVQYVGILNNEIGWSAEDAMMFAIEKHGTAETEEFLMMWLMRQSEVAG
jgi:filamentous hemagglutinin family protein